MGRRLRILEDEDEEGSELVTQARPRGGNQKSIRDTNSDVSSSIRGDVGPVEGDPAFHRKPRGIITEERMAETMHRYGVPPKFACRLSGDSECISCPSSIEVVMCEETFRARFHFPPSPLYRTFFR